MFLSPVPSTIHPIKPSQDSASNSQQEALRKYREPRKSWQLSKKVSREQAIKQILRYSKVPRMNLYATSQLNKDGALILKTSH